jgi:hypothetical protein
MVVPIHSETGDSLADQDLPGANPAIPSIHLGIDASSSDLGRPRNFRTAATSRATLSTQDRRPLRRARARGQVDRSGAGVRAATGACLFPRAFRVTYRSHFKMLTARATTNNATMSEIASSAIIINFIHGLIADTSVGLNAVAVAKAKWK